MTSHTTQQAISFEFFPTKTSEGAAKLALVRDKLSILRPQYYSVTYGAGGSTQDGTINTVKSIIDAGEFTEMGNLRLLSSVLSSFVEGQLNRYVRSQFIKQPDENWAKKWQLFVLLLK